MTRDKRKIELVDLTGDDQETAKAPSKKQCRQYLKGTTANEGWSSPVSSLPLSSQPSTYKSSRSLSNYDLLSSSITHSQAERDSWLASTQQIEDDINGEVDDDNFDDEMYENRQLYGVLHTKIVGCQYYNGRATPGEYTAVRREPKNSYDRNAIRIDNVMRAQIGHIGRNIAAKLAPLIDSGELVLEGVLTGVKSHFDCPIGLKMFGTTDPAGVAALKTKMQELRLPITELNKTEKEREKHQKEMEKQAKAREKAAAAMKKNGNTVIEPDGPARYTYLASQSSSENPFVQNMEQLLSGTATFNPRDVQSALDKLAAGEEVLSKMGMAEQPHAMSTVLLPYQRQGLKWLIDHESPKMPPDGSNETVQLWKSSGKIYTNIATSFSVTRFPILASGGILSDDMGLGKTVQMLSLIVADPKKNTSPTLIVAPLSVMSNWSSQAATHIRKKYALRVLTYHGQGSKGITAAKLKEYDLVITTYQTMTLEMYPYGKIQASASGSKKPLFDLTWRRVVLDEGHSIRNPKSKMAQAACALKAQSRWILTGTPIVNSLKDLYSHVKFLALSGGLAEFEIFNSCIIRTVKNGDRNGQLLLQALMADLCLRRMKDMKFVDLNLPTITYHKFSVRFAPHEQERYDAFKAEAKGVLEEAKAKKGENTYTHLLEILLRMRQTCNHWKMCGEERIKKLLSLVEENVVVDIMNPANRKALQDLLQLRIDSHDDCPVCMDSIREPMITACAHAYCRSCIEKVIETQRKCPMCRAELVDISELVSPAAEFDETDDQPIEIDPETSSTKIQAMVKLLLASDKEKDTKTVVFSQWTSFLDILQVQLDRNGLVHTRLDGKMSATKRDAAVESLQTDPQCKIMLASLSVCSVGLNLVAANQVFLADSWWAPAIEDQAVDRIHRLGQTRECKMTRFVVENTVEDDVLEIQEKKRKLAGLAFGEKSNKKRERAGNMNDIVRLLG